MPVVNMERSDWKLRAFLPMGWHHDHPATTVFVGGFDPLQKWQNRYYEGLKKSGKEAELFYLSKCHSHILLPSGVGRVFRVD
ncbi:hypothetical protein C1H46_006447 [Malus baccata]|uniref:Uncharacterized protein n=1 Tax=Malus baccata TaxID=106549 RepID=A0A540NA33_MALBA|nr:hypothetical protein C1H46_006447 [Malus baccata]